MIGAIVRGEELADIGAVGIRKIGSPEPIRVDDAVHLGSCTKAMTATMIGTLVDEGKLRWDSTIARGLPRSGRADPSRLPAGHPRPAPDPPGRASRTTSPGGELGRGLLGRRAAPGPDGRERSRTAPETKPGSTYAYSNVGYVLAGMMAEQVTADALGRPDEASALRAAGDDLGGVRPAGDARGGSTTPGATGPRANLVEAVHEDNPPSMGPAGTVHCSVPDWAKFASFHLRGSLGGVRLLKPETLKALHTPEPGEDYAGGWLVVDRSWAGRTA